MTAMDAVAELERIGIVPVVVLDDARHGSAVAEALLAGGIGCAEFTLRTHAGLGALREAARVSGFLAGAGTVLDEAQVDAVAEAGARFLVSPGSSPTINERAGALEIAAVPGIATPSELQQAREHGHTHVKLFPAGAFGGPSYVDALAGPFPDMRILPSGGVSPQNAAAYLERPTVFAVSGSWMVPRAAIAAGDFAAIRQLARECRELHDQVRGSL